MRHPMNESELEESWLVQSYKSYMERQERVNRALVKLSKERNIKCVATNDTHYLNKEDWIAHEVLINIQSGEPLEIWERDSLGNPLSRIPNPKRRAYPSRSFHFPKKEEMEELFKDLPEALTNTKEVADKCDLQLDLKTKHYPVYCPPTFEEGQDQKKAAQEYLWKLCKEGVVKRYTPERLEEIKRVYNVDDPMEVVEKRLQREMDVIVPKEMSDYLLIVWDFIHWAKKNQIPVGPGRGSGAGSIVLYLIGITDIEPLRFHLFFERFINPERLSYPDIDVDICMDRRGDVINYTLEKYGKENVAQIITFGTMKAKMAVKDVGRVLNVPLVKVNNIAKLIPEDLNITLEKALEKDQDLNNLYNNDEEVKRVIDLAMRLEGSIRNTGIHAAGLVISADTLTDNIR
jgi:DNA polymerase-3 subunit alpha